MLSVTASLYLPQIILFLLLGAIGSPKWGFLLVASPVFLPIAFVAEIARASEESALLLSLPIVAALILVLTWMGRRDGSARITISSITLVVSSIVAFLTFLASTAPSVPHTLY
jgi:hypothetical protein